MYFQTKPAFTAPTSDPASAGAASGSTAPAAVEGGIPSIDAKDVPRAPDSIIDMEVLGQIREMDELDEEDEDEDEEAEPFSKGIVYGYFDQAEQTFDDMQKAL